MIIGIDGNEANVALKVGIGEYSFEILKNFKEITNFKSQATNKFSNIKFQIYLKEPPRPEMPKDSANWEYIIVKPHKLWTQIGLPIYLFTHFPRPDVFFSPSHYAPRLSPVKTAIAVMDISFLRFPELFAKKDLYQLINWTKYSARNAKKVFTISTASKNDIIKAYSKRADDIIVTYPGIRQELSSMNNVLSKKKLQEKYEISENYILFVGTLQPRKNIIRLVEAFSHIKHGMNAEVGIKFSHAAIEVAKPKQGANADSENSVSSPRITDLQLVLVGKKGWLYEEILAAPEKYGVSESVKFLDFVPTEDLPSLYTNALCYVLPSLYEGFGLPVLEAMKYGCPVITSNVSSLPEAGGDAAIYVDPENVNDIAAKIVTVIDDEKLRKSMIQKGYEHIKKFSWEKAAKETLTVLEELGKK